MIVNKLTISAADKYYRLSSLRADKFDRPIRYLAIVLLQCLSLILSI